MARVPGRTALGTLMLGGSVVYAVSYGLLLTNRRILFTSTGISNGVSIAGALGIAMCLSGFLIVHGLAAMWSDAWDRQRDILADISARLPR